MRLPPNAEAPGRARDFLRAEVCAAHNARVLEEAELLVSELVTNAVLHGTPPVSVLVECDGGLGLCVSVSDQNPQPPAGREPGAEEESGRGLRLVDMISDRWGVHSHPGDGKDVWFRVRR